ncbi:MULTISPECIES: 23S rRNA (adenine(2030)-N(6))-methyltransferase RlmJ [Phyllobacterium]|jgi:23S rRNA (adenine2030-N6)-methyltransferase|uniref:Ribosomal RNA large subunit methyltransferase J n=1 Tax=Phyllobacterium sophorae TaxID=1520277 RepID=A0A2P7BAQ2_9HYPH|nr:MULTISPECIES: 23S rRNA (adenine(2030)-N(6))-methyltransferase RlmJ [Phyllobacterium]PSH63554.1 23S rRNA (adenine(2030)-N(6))-methyltransferase RlmJ [Phyllobacterium sophorae]UXN65892.1 23S rRNA (adenine(2030)-N(6))-methyltransferase RlmJ [Phyllobacterium sp. A18/5-2]
MNYRHAYHAGNFADVVKHIILTRIVLYLQRKDQAFRVIDTHAGIGRYDLHGVEAGKTNEWQSGVGRLLDAKADAKVAELIQPYLDIVRAENADGTMRHYPGSPLIVRHLLRRQDRLSALELHPRDAQLLADVFEGDIQVRVTKLDGWLALGAHLPPKEKRGLVLVDPPFEVAGEFERLVDGLVRAHKRFSGGTFALWYPVKDRQEVRRFVTALQETGIPKILRAELMIRDPSPEPKLDGTGMIIVNPPYTLDDELRTILPALSKILSDGKNSGFTLDWIRGEQVGA